VQGVFLRTALGVFLVVLVLAVILAITTLEVQSNRERNTELTVNLRHTQKMAHAEKINADIKLESALEDEIQDMRIVRDVKGQVGAILVELITGVAKVKMADPKRKEIDRVLNMFKAKLSAVLDNLYQHMKKERAQAEESIRKLNTEVREQIGQERQEQRAFQVLLSTAVRSHRAPMCCAAQAPVRLLRRRQRKQQGR
jgi:gamma-glutamylcysteine synthetase